MIFLYCCSFLKIYSFLRSSIFCSCMWASPGFLKVHAKWIWLYNWTSVIQNKISPRSYNSYVIMVKEINICSFLYTRYIGDASFAKAVNLEQFYKGYLSFGCFYTKSTNKKVEMQKFEFSEDSDPEAPTYKCYLGPEGCHDDEDCHYEHPFWCSCAGESCVRYKNQETDSGSKKKTAFAESSRTWSWHGCVRNYFKCYCKNKNKNFQESWNGDTDDALRDVHSIMMKRRRDQARSNGTLF